MRLNKSAVGVLSVVGVLALAAVSHLLASSPASAAAPQVVALVTQAGPSSSVLDAARQSAFATVITGATTTHSRLLIDGVDASGPGTQPFSGRMLGAGPNPLFAKQDLARKQAAVRRTTEAVLSGPRLNQLSLLSALGGLAGQLHTAAHGRVNVAIVGSALPMNPLAGGRRLDLRRPATVINEFVRANLAFSCRDWRVAIVDGNFNAAGAQLSPVASQRLEAFWRLLFRNCGGELVAWTPQLLSYPVSGKVLAPIHNLILVTPHAHRVLVDIRADLAFATGAATLLPAARHALSTIIPELQASRGVIGVSGYCDSTGDAAINGPLADARALAVKRWIVANTGINPARVHAKGFGASDPVAPNATAAGRSANRRVVISIPTRG